MAKDIKTVNDPRGSIWRKWDLHVHTPASKLNNQFEGVDEAEKWDKYCTKIEQLDISVIAPTNYFLTNGWALEIYEKSLGPDHPYTQGAQSNLESLK